MTNEVKNTTAPAPTGAVPAPAAPAAASKESKTSFDVVTADGVLVRTYTVEEHGPKAGELAKEYAGKIQGSIK